MAAVVGMVLIGCTNPQKEDQTMKEQTIIENILTRKSVRYFTGDTISQAQVETLLRCAMAAPSAMNKQPWAFIVVTDPDLLARIGSEMPNTRCQNRPACAFVPCGDLSKALESRPDFWINDVSAATENLLLAAHAMGLGRRVDGYPSRPRPRSAGAGNPAPARAYRPPLRSAHRCPRRISRPQRQVHRGEYPLQSVVAVLPLSL